VRLDPGHYGRVSINLSSPCPFREVDYPFQAAERRRPLAHGEPAVGKKDAKEVVSPGWGDVWIEFD
jgi:hypothetical protein